MRILFLNHNIAYSGGTFNRALQVGQQLAQRGHQVTLHAVSKSNRGRFAETNDGGVTVVETPDLLPGRARTGWDPYDAVRRSVRARSEPWDLVHAWDCRPAVIWPALVARRASSATLAIDWCDWWGRGGTIQERSGWLVRTFFGPIETYFEEAYRTKADVTTVISEPLRARAVGLGVRPESIHWLPQGCDIDAIVPGDRNGARERLGLSQTTPLLASVGIIQGSDGRLMWDTLRAITASRPDARLLLIGRHRSNVPPDLAGAVIETGFVSDQELRDFTDASDLMLTPLADTVAARARWPSKVNHYLAAGKAIAITAVGDLPALLARRSAASVVPPEAGALAAAALRLLDDPAERQRLGDAARATAEQELAWPLVIDGLEAAYERGRSNA